MVNLLTQNPQPPHPGHLNFWCDEDSVLKGLTLIQDEVHLQKFQELMLARPVDWHYISFLERVARHPPSICSKVGRNLLDFAFKSSK
jgi:hypothetical protein